MNTSVRNLHEQHHYERIRSYFDPAVIRLILSNTAADYEKRLQGEVEKRFVPSVETRHHACLTNALAPVSEFFQPKGDVILYVDESSGASTRTYPTTDEETDNYIVFPDDLLSRLTDSELLFIVAHEVSHIAFQHAVISWIIETVYPKGQSIPPIIENEWNVWIHLAELSADNAGLRICGNRDAAASALRKALSSSDPALARRVACLDNREEAERYYGEIIHRVSGGYPEAYTKFFEKAVVFISRLDGHLHSEEEEFILNRLSRQKYVPYNPVYTNETIALTDLVVEGRAIARLFPERTKEIFLNLSALTLRDSVLTSGEYDVLNILGSEAFGFSPQTIDSLFISVIRSNFFRPYDEL